MNAFRTRLKPRVPTLVRTVRSSQGRTNFSGCFAQVLFAVVGAPRPEETFQTIALAPWHDVDMEVGHALAHIVVDRDEGSFSVQGVFNGPLETLRGLEQRPDLRRGEVGQRDNVARGNQQYVPGE